MQRVSPTAPALLDPAAETARDRADQEARQRKSHLSKLQNQFKDLQLQLKNGLQNDAETRMVESIRDAGLYDYLDMQTRYKEKMGIYKTIRDRLATLDTDLTNAREKSAMLDQHEEKVAKAADDLAPLVNKHGMQEMRRSIEWRLTANRNLLSAYLTLCSWKQDLTALKAATLQEMEYRERASALKERLTRVVGINKAQELVKPLDVDFAAWEATKKKQIGFTHQSIVEAGAVGVKRPGALHSTSKSRPTQHKRSLSSELYPGRG